MMHHVKMKHLIRQSVILTLPAFYEGAAAKIQVEHLFLVLCSACLHAKMILSVCVTVCAIPITWGPGNPSQRSQVQHVTHSPEETISH